MNKFLIEEVKTIVGSIFMDVRGDWSYGVEERLENARGWLEFLVEHDSDNAMMYQADINLIIRFIGEVEGDGRVFRDEALLYGYSSKEGMSQRVKEYLQTILHNPDYT